jgi:hypothetical protein
LLLIALLTGIEYFVTLTKVAPTSSRAPRAR